MSPPKGDPHRGRSVESVGKRKQRLGKAALVSLQPGSLGKEYRLTVAAVTLGREPDNDIVLESPRISRHHARLDWTGAEYVLEDLGSKNGTWVNGRRLDGAISLGDGDTIRFGDLTFAFKMQGASTQTLIGTPSATRETITVMFADLEGHTCLFEALGLEAVSQLLDDHLSVMKAQVIKHGGRTVKTEGDGLIACFTSVRQAADCSVQIQRAVARLKSSGDGKSLPVRIGVNSGEALKQGADLVGLAVVKAERIMRLAGGGQIYFSEVSRSLLGPASGLRILSKGWHQLKGLSRKERVFEVAWQ